MFILFTFFSVRDFSVGKQLLIVSGKLNSLHIVHKFIFDLRVTSGSA